MTCTYESVNNHGKYKCHNPSEGEFCGFHEQLGRGEREEIARFATWLDGLLDGSILFTGRDA